MSQCAIECDQVWKMFCRGERNDSLRDAVPALFKWILRRQSADLGKNQFWVLSDVSFKVHRGEALGVIGPNGAGKSTLLRILSSILVPDRGSIVIDGRLTALIEVGEDFTRIFTGTENIYLNGAVLGMTRREIRSKIGDIVDFAGVGEFIDTPIKRYSSGMQARLGFSVAAHMNPDILLVDEVLAVGDGQFQQRCLEKMHYFAHSGRAIIFISHNLQAVAELCPQTMLLINGQKKFLGDTQDAMRQYLDHMREQTVAPMSGPVSIHRVRLVDQQGHECNRFDAGAQARLTFQMTLDQPASNYFLGFALRRATDGLIVADYNLPMPLDDAFCGSTPMALDFETNFLTGSYSVTLFLVHRPTYHKPVYLDFVKIFDVAEPLAHAGLTHVEPRIRILESNSVTSSAAT